MTEWYRGAHHTFVGMRADDVLAAVQYLASLGVTQGDAEAEGPSALALLHAAVFEPRIVSMNVTRNALQL